MLCWSDITYGACRVTILICIHSILDFEVASISTVLFPISIETLVGSCSSYRQHLYPHFFTMLRTIVSTVLLSFNCFCNILK